MSRSTVVEGLRGEKGDLGPTGPPGMAGEKGARGKRGKRVSCAWPYAACKCTMLQEPCRSIVHFSAKSKT